MHFQKLYLKDPQLVRNSGLIKQVFFPRELLIANVSAFQLVRLALSLIIVPIYMAYMGIPITSSILLFCQYLWSELFSLAMDSLLLCVAVVHVRDTTMVIDISLRALFFLSGVFYSAAYIPSEYLDYHLMNPIASYIEICRAAVLSDLSYISPMIVLRCISLSILIFLIGSGVFNRYQNWAVIHFEVRYSHRTERFHS